MGYPLRLGDIAIETLVPKGTSLADLAKFDQDVAQRAKTAADNKTVLRYADSKQADSQPGGASGDTCTHCSPHGIE
jgi:hypothetical protein